MNSKWYISTLLVLLSLIGLTFGRSKVVNQEIVLQFSDTEATSGSGQGHVLAAITAKLQALGITDIEVLKNDEAQLSLRYYSDIDAQHIKEFLSNNDGLSLNLEELDELPFDFPEDELPETCSLVVLDLHEAKDVLSLKGKVAFELHQDYHKFLKVPGIPINTTTVIGGNVIDDLLYKVNRTIAIAIDNVSYTFPEVRAGPSLQIND